MELLTEQENDRRVLKSLASPIGGVSRWFLFESTFEPVDNYCYWPLDLFKPVGTVGYINYNWAMLVKEKQETYKGFLDKEIKKLQKEVFKNEELYG